MMGRTVGGEDAAPGTAMQAGYHMMQPNTTVSGKGSSKVKNLSLSGTNALKQSTDLRMMNLQQQKRLNSDVTSVHGVKD